MFDIIGFGALNMDMMYKVDVLSAIEVAGKPCEPGAEIFIGEEEFQSLDDQLKKHGSFQVKSAGGSAANTAVAMAGMGHSAGYIGRVGDDEAGEQILQSMGSVDTTRITRGGVTGVTIVLLDPDGERTIVVLPNANDDLAYEDIDLEYAANCAYLHLTSFAGDTPTLAQITLAQTIPEATAMSFDPGEIHTQKGLVKMMPILRRSNVVFITDREIRLLTGEDYVDGAHEILNYGPEIVVAKLGKAGSYILAGDQEFSVRSGAVAAVDKTGAGDVYAAGFLAGLIRGLPPLRCAEAADKAASHSVTGWGREAYPDASLFNRAG